MSIKSLSPLLALSLILTSFTPPHGNPQKRLGAGIIGVKYENQSTHGLSIFKYHLADDDENYTGYGPVVGFNQYQQFTTSSGPMYFDYQYSGTLPVPVTVELWENGTLYGTVSYPAGTVDPQFQFFNLPEVDGDGWYLYWTD